MTQTPSLAPQTPGMTLRVWGAAGSAPVAGGERAEFGGDTICFELWSGQPGADPVIIDMGTAAIQLGRELTARAEATGAPLSMDILLSHFHLDHIFGLPFFEPFYKDGAEIRLHSGLVADEAEFRKTLKRIASPPIFPISTLDWGAGRFTVFAPGDAFQIAGLTVTTMAMHHPGGSVSFRFDGPDGAICILGDHEHGDPETDAALTKFVAGADAVFFDASFHDHDYEEHRGWGHSTWSQGLVLADRADMGMLFLHHHFPSRTDAALAAIDARVRDTAPNVRLARQRMELRLIGGELTVGTF